MQCVCERKGQTRGADGKIRFYSLGQVDDFEECPRNFRPLEGEDSVGIDFATAGEGELLAGNFELGDLKSFMREKYGLSAGNRGLEKTVAMVLEYRQRNVSPEEIKVLSGSEVI